MPINIEIHGIDQLIKKLDRVQAVQVLEAPIQRAVLRLQRDMAEYPPQRTGSRYRRTGTLGRRWTTRVNRSGNGVEGRVGNNIAYGPWVQSKRFQARVHRGHWTNTDEDVLERNRRAIEDDFARAIDQALSR